MKISVALIVYNGSNYMKIQLDSILAQSHKVDEIVVFEDVSTDNTKEILELYKKEYPELFFLNYNSENIGMFKNIEKAIKFCTGNIILLTDHDDYWCINKVETLVKWFDQNPNMNGVFTNGSVMNSNDILNNTHNLWETMGFPYKEIKNNEDLKLYINTVENCVTGATLAIRNNLPFLKHSFPSIKNLVHDRWLAINLAEKNSLGILNEKIIHYRIHANQAIGGKTDDVEKYLSLNNDMYGDAPNTKKSIKSFKDLRYILNKIETNLQIQNEINTLSDIDLNSYNYVKILKIKHNKYLQLGFKRWPILSSCRKLKKLILG